jgi:hypothetical protein
VPPGGPISEDERDCGPAKNHCMRGNAWLATGISGPADIRGAATAAFPFDGHWYTYSGEQAESTVYRTKPATADEIQHARLVWVLDVGHNEFSDVKSFLPKSEKEALTTRRWQSVSPESVDAKAGTFTAGRTLYKIEAARVGVEAKSAD